MKRTQKSAFKYLCKPLSKFKSKNSVSRQRVTLPKQVDVKLVVVKGIILIINFYVSKIFTYL